MQLRRNTGLAGLGLGVAALALLTLPGCIPPAPEPTPAPSPMPTPVAQPTAAPPQVVTPTYDNWMDAPQTPGDWSYLTQGSTTMAVFGPDRLPQNASLMLSCDSATRRVSIGRAGSATGQVEMRIRTEAADRVLTAGPVQAPAPMLVAQLAASDALLDAIAFSRGRFAVDVAGQPALYVPAWPEVTRVVEDCRG